jgi:antitoxin YefM
MVLMQGVLNASDVRKNWSEFMDQVVTQNKPQLVARNNKHPFLSLSLDQARLSYAAYRFKAEIVKEEDETYTIDLDEFDLFVNSTSQEEGLRDLAEELLEYAQDYINSIQLYFNAPNRKNHFPYVMNVLLQDDITGVRNLIDA